MIVKPGLEDSLVVEIIENFDHWRKRYREWEANRKDFLYPDNYLVANTRAPFTALRRSLSMLNLALVSSAGAYIDGTDPFDTNAPDGDFTFRELPTEIDLSDLRFSARGYDSTFVQQDGNVQVPLARLLVSRNEACEAERAEPRRHEREDRRLSAPQSQQRLRDRRVWERRLGRHRAVYDRARVAHRCLVDARHAHTPAQRHGHHQLPAPVAVEVEAVVRGVVAGDERHSDNSTASVHVQELPRVRLRSHGDRDERDGEHARSVTDRLDG